MGAPRRALAFLPLELSVPPSHPAGDTEDLGPGQGQSRFPQSGSGCGDSKALRPLVPSPPTPENFIITDMNRDLAVCQGLLQAWADVCRARAHFLQVSRSMSYLFSLAQVHTATSIVKSQFSPLAAVHVRAKNVLFLHLAA